MTPPTEVPDVLRLIVERRRERLHRAAVTRGVPTIPAAASDPLLTAAENAFLGALDAAAGRAVIAEIKMGSPSLGSLAGRFDPLGLARDYAAHGAVALSVVVEPDFFHGSYELLAECRRASGLPAIAKEFVVDLVQLDWAREAGATAVLLIAALHEKPQLRAWARAARERGLVPLIEVHDDDDLGRLAGAEWELVGVNNRDLRTFDVDLAHGERMAAKLPGGSLKVGESGIRGPGDLARLAEAGYHAFLVGEHLVTAVDPAAALRELVA